MSFGTTNVMTDLTAIAKAFSLHGCYLAGAPYGNGHINDTYAVTYEEHGRRIRYILQRINDRVFRNVPALMENIQRVTTHLARGDATAGRRTLTIVPTREGAAYHRDSVGGYWRCYVFIENAQTYEILQDPRQAREAARAFGEFQCLLVNLGGPRLHDTIPHFHDTRHRFDALQRAVAADRHGRAAAAETEIAFALAREAMVDVLLNLQARGEIPERITHNDTKLNNVMLDDTTGQGVCVIDFDTVMPGLVLYDFGDMVRSAANSAAEDETDLSRVRMQLPVFAVLVEGYLASAGPLLNETERAYLAFAARLITFEIGLRFLTDFLEGDTYFKIHRSVHNLDRCRCQFALVRSMETQAAEMNAVVEKLTS
jgi:hypothetical protein